MEAQRDVISYKIPNHLSGTLNPSESPIIPLNLPPHKHQTDKWPDPTKQPLSLNGDEEEQPPTYPNNLQGEPNELQKSEKSSPNLIVFL